MYRQFRPAATIITDATIASDMDVPKSGSTRTSPTRGTTTTTIGKTEYVTSSMRCLRRSSASAMKMMPMIFASSDG